MTADPTPRVDETAPTAGSSGDTELAGIDIAGAVRAHRLAAGLTMRELAARAGMSQPFLSNLENSRAMPSIATLYKIASALDVSPREFLPDVRTRVQLVRRGDGALGPVGDEPGTATTRVVSGAPGRLVEAHTYVAEPGTSMGDWFEHDGEDLLYVIAGTLTVELGDGQAFELEAGDVLWYDGNLAHRWTPTGDRTAELLCVHARPPTAAAAHATAPDRR